MTHPPTFTPGPAPAPLEPLALDRPKGLNELFRAAWALWTGHTGVFLVTAALVVIPFEVIVTGLLGGGFNNSLGTPALWAQIVGPLFMGTVGTALITATHSRAVVAMSRGEQLTTADAFELGMKNIGIVAATAVVYLLAMVVGFFLVFIPMIFIAVAGVFAAQISALHGKGPVDSLKQSVKVVQAAGWWRTFGYLFVLSLVSSGTLLVLGIFIGVLSVATGDNPGFGAFAVPASAIIQAGVMSWTALVTTLLYFSWRAEQGDPFAGGGGAPVGPVVPVDSGTPHTAPGTGPIFTK